MFPISSDGGFKEPSTCFDEDKFVQDLLADCPTSEGNNLTADKKIVKKRKRKVEENNEGSTNSNKSTAHRFIEKQRRQEMRALHASLRSLLPLEYVKGKRAISDHMQEAVNYISDMKKKIDEMKMRRDKLKRLYSSGDCDGSQSSNSPNSCVEIKLLMGGLMEILISCSLEKENFPLSNLLEDLLRRQLNVIDCVSATYARCCLHKIHIELNDPTSIDLSELQEGLVNVIRFA